MIYSRFYTPGGYEKNFFHSFRRFRAICGFLDGSPSTKPLCNKGGKLSANGDAESVDREGGSVYIVCMAALLGTFEQMVLLAVMAAGEEAYGRAVLRTVQASLGAQRTVSAGAVYATLDRLEAEGLVTSRLEEGTPARGGRVRRFYRLTTPGAHALSEARKVLERMWRGVTWPAEAMG